MTKTIAAFAALPALLVALRILLTAVAAVEYYTYSLAQTYTSAADAAAAVWSIVGDPFWTPAGGLAVIAVLAARDTTRIRRTLRNERAAAAPRPAAAAANAR